MRFTKNANFKIALKTNQASKSSGKSQVKWLVEKVLFCFLKTSNLNYIFFLQILTLAPISRSFFTSVVVTIKMKPKVAVCLYGMVGRYNQCPESIPKDVSYALNSLFTNVLTMLIMISLLTVGQII